MKLTGSTDKQRAHDLWTLEHNSRCELAEQLALQSDAEGGGNDSREGVQMLADAVKELQQVIRILEAGHIEDAHKVKVFKMLGVVLRKQGKRKEAKAAFRRAAVYIKRTWRKKKDQPKYGGALLVPHDLRASVARYLRIIRKEIALATKGNSGSSAAALINAGGGGSAMDATTAPLTKKERLKTLEDLADLLCDVGELKAGAQRYAEYLTVAEGSDDPRLHELAASAAQTYAEIDDLPNALKYYVQEYRHLLACGTASKKAAALEALWQIDTLIGDGDGAGTPVAGHDIPDGFDPDRLAALAKGIAAQLLLVAVSADDADSDVSSDIDARDTPMLANTGAHGTNADWTPTADQRAQLTALQALDGPSRSSPTLSPSSSPEDQATSARNGGSGAHVRLASCSYITEIAEAAKESATADARSAKANGEDGDDDGDAAGAADDGDQTMDNETDVSLTESDTDTEERGGGGGGGGGGARLP